MGPHCTRHPTSAETRVFDHKGSLIAKGEPSSKLSTECIRYDPQGRKVQRDQCEDGISKGMSTDYLYNEIGQLIERKDTGGHDPANGRSVIYRYDTSGRLTEQIERRLDGTDLFRLVFTYDPDRHKREKITYSSNGREGQRMVETYDERGHVVLTEVFEPEEAQPFRESRYAYDGCGNPVEVVISSPSVRERSKERSVYKYDAYGNWISRTTIQQFSFLDKQSRDMKELTSRIITYYAPSTVTTEASTCSQPWP